ncbi:DUF4870 domain-containing protein [Mangrovibacterium lignilyticum]|uniref:DUF4870 domain-containing protein n=1 Tax=Mangrovibacterium lignilyticum TaxID=2668052 RepID=UPI0013D48E0C|nr:DUF4870 domain-containing protein [Mangrovibacterium lignilyticum]
MERIIDNPDERTWGMLCHLSALAGAIIPFGNIIGPIIVYSVKRGEYDFVEDQGKESLNFQITMTLALIVSGILVILLVGFLLLALVGLFALVFTLIGAIKAGQGEFYRYPITYRFLK